MKPEKQLYQWDINQYLTGINPAAQFVDYPIGDEVIRLETDGTRCRIPDEVLQTYGGKTCYERYPDGTYRAYSFTVLYAPKPPDYVYTPEERTTFEALTARVDSAIEEIKRRADSGEFTPVKGVDYFTNAEKNELMESVSSGAVGEFRKVVDTATAEYNDNHTEKMTAYDANAADKLSTYNSNAEQKLESYNQNHTEKVAEYNQNAENKTAEFDSNAAALQTEVDRLRGECDTLAAENRKQENRIDALMKLNKGQTYDILTEEGEAASRTAPSGSHYASVDMVGGKSVVWNQIAPTKYYSRNGIVPTYSDGVISLSGTATNAHGAIANANIFAQHWYYLKVETIANPNSLVFQFGSLNRLGSRYIAGVGESVSWLSIANSDFFDGYGFSNLNVVDSLDGIQLRFSRFDLTQMFGAGNEPATVEEFEAMFHADYYPYSEPTIISSQTDRVDVVSADGTTSQQITTSFPVLNSAGSVYDYIDLNEGKLHQRVGVVDLGTLYWTYNSEYRFMLANVYGKRPGAQNLIMSRYNLSPNELWQQDGDRVYGGNEQNNIIYIKDLNYSDPAAFKVAISGVMLHYELETPTTEPVTIPEALQEWLPVEPGGTVAFRNADESKQLPVPNSVSWVRKLDEVE